MGAEPVAILDIDGRPVPLRLRRNGRARRILLRLDKQGDGVVVTLPKWVPEIEGIAWVEKQVAWIANRLSALPTRTPFSDGA
ncbi:MAG: M48 family peptidase, partial [Alphaproteobacteria bacterium]|nr:M48 family peptidase [Alphaproteobacteria bacterium]